MSKIDNWHLILDDGHGISTPGKRSPLFLETVVSNSRTFEEGDCFIENWFNQKVVDMLKEMAISKGLTVSETAPEHEDVRLSERMRRENLFHDNYKKVGKQSIFISAHADAYEPAGQLVWNKANGSTAFYYEKGDAFSAEGKKLAEIIAKRAVFRTKINNRGARGANFFALRKSKSISCLFEGGFMTNPDEVLKLDDPAFQAATATGILEGILEYIEA